MQFRLLGLLEVEDEHGPVRIVPGRESALLALLLLHAPEALPADRIVEEVWGDAAPVNAAKSVQVYVSRLRKALGGERIETTPAGYRIRLEPGELDVRRFEELVGNRRWREGLALWRGEPLADFRYAPFAQGEARRLEGLHDEAVAGLLDERLAAGEAPVAELEALVARDPLWERPRGQLMHALYLAGRQAEALELYRRTRELLDDELGVEPGPELQRLERSILNQDPELGTPAPSSRVSSRRAGRRLLVGGCLLVVAAVAAGAVATSLGRDSGTPVRGSAIAVVDWSRPRADAQIEFASPQSSIAVGDGQIWALNGDTGAVTSIDATTMKTLATFSGGQRPIDLAFGGGSFWILSGGFQPAPGEPGRAIAPEITRYDPQSHTPIGSTPVPDVPEGVGFFYFHHRPGQHELAFGDGSLWLATAASLGGSVYRIDAVSGHVVAHIANVDAGTLAFSGHSLWAENLDAFPNVEIDRVDAATNSVVRRLELPVVGASSFAVGDGAVWVPDFYGGLVWKVIPGPPQVERPVVTTPGATSVVYARRALWIGNNWDDTLRKVDPVTLRVVSTLRVPGPQALAVVGRSLLVATAATAGSTLPSTSCGPVQYGGPGRPDFLVAADLDFRGVPAANIAMSEAALSVLRSAKFRAGRYTIGYQSCDDSSGIAGVFDPGKCAGNATLYAKTPKVIGVVGPYDSGCAGEELPILESAPSGPVALVSPTNTFDFLTRGTPGLPPDMLAHLYPLGLRNYVRVIAPDAAEVAADALFARKLGLRRVAILDDGGHGAGTLSHIAWFRYSASRMGMRTSVLRPRSVSDLLSALRATRAQGMFVADGVPFDPARFYPAVRRALGERWPIIGTDLLGPNPYNTGVYLSSGGLPNPRLPAQARRFLRGLPRAAPSISAAYAGAAMQVLLAAIARSTGTRRSVVRELFKTDIRNGLLGRLRFTPHGDPVAAPVSIFRSSPRPGADAYFAHEEFVQSLVPPARVVVP